MKRRRRTRYGQSPQMVCPQKILMSQERDTLKYVVNLQFSTTNNEAKYETLITGLKLAKMLITRRIVIQANSQLIIEQMKGVYEAREDRMKKYLNLVQKLLPSFDEAIFQQILRSENEEANSLAKITSSEEYNLVTDLNMEIQEKPSIDRSMVMPIQEQDK